MNYVYILKCNDDESYMGRTSDLKKEVEKHRNKEIPETAEKLPVKLVSYFAFSDKDKGLEFEKYLTSGSGKGFIKKHIL